MHLTNEDMAAAWQDNARQWYEMGVMDRGDACQAIADYWRLPLFWRIVNIWKIMRVVKEMRQR